MSDTAEDVRFSMKVMINKEKSKVLFAHANNDFIDVLLSFLALPLGRIVKLLERHYGDKSPDFGSLTSLYKGLENLDDVHFSTSAAKLMLLHPRSTLDSISRKLKLDISDSTPIKYFTCIYYSSHGHKYICMDYCGSARCACGRPLNREATIKDSENDSEDAGVFTINTASFVISDDLRIMPSSTGFFQALSNLGITDTAGAELRNVTFGTDEIMDLLKCCLLSNTPLTDLILNKGKITISSAAKCEPGYFLHRIDEEETSNSKIILKVVVRKSNNTLLFAQADDDFIELLFSLLIIPVGGVESLLDTNTSLMNLDNLYRSISDVIVDKYFLSIDTKKKLMNPDIPCFYMSGNTFLPLIEESNPIFYYKNYEYINMPILIYSRNPVPGCDELISFKSPKGEGNYVKKPTTYMVTDNLTVTPFCMATSTSLLNLLDVPLFDVDELEVRIGLQEALSILKASLTTNSALTNGLMNHIMKKQPKQER